MLFITVTSLTQLWLVKNKGFFIYSSYMKVCVIKLNHRDLMAHINSEISFPLTSCGKYLFTNTKKVGYTQGRL